MQAAIASHQLSSYPDHRTERVSAGNWITTYSFDMFALGFALFGGSPRHNLFQRDGLHD